MWRLKENRYTIVYLESFSKYIWRGGVFTVTLYQHPGVTFNNDHIVFHKSWKLFGLPQMLTHVIRIHSSF